MRTRRRWRWIGAAVAFLTLLDVGLVAAHTVHVRRFTARHVASDLSALVPHDAAVVFFGALGRNGALDSGTQRRISDAVILYRARRIRTIIAVGGARAGWRRLGSALMADALVARGVPRDRVLHDNSSFDSVTNWREAQAIATANGLTSLVLVSTPTHLARLQTIVGDHTPPPRYFSKGEPPQHPVSWWMSAHRELASSLALRILPRQWYVSLMRRMRQGNG